VRAAINPKQKADGVVKYGWTGDNDFSEQEIVEDWPRTAWIQGGSALSLIRAKHVFPHRS
jgi:hypothetical protein